MFSLVAHGWNIDIGAELIGSDSVRFFRGVGTVRTRMFRICTLLGPEGPGLTRKWVGIEPLDLFLLAMIGWRRGYRPYFENYTVDASILDSRLSSLGSQDQIDTPLECW